MIPGLAARVLIAVLGPDAGCKIRQSARAPRPNDCASRSHLHASHPYPQARRPHLPVLSARHPSLCGLPQALPYPREYAPQSYQAPAILPDRLRRRLRLALIVADQSTRRFVHPALQCVQLHSGLRERYTVLRHQREPRLCVRPAFVQSHAPRPVHPCGFVAPGGSPLRLAHQPPR